MATSDVAIPGRRLMSMSALLTLVFILLNYYYNLLTYMSGEKRCIVSASELRAINKCPLRCTKCSKKTHQKMRQPNVTSLYFATPLAFNAPDEWISLGRPP